MSEIIYPVLITYDIKSNHTEVRNTLITEYDFKEIIVGDTGTKCYLPNTTLYKRNTTKLVALNTLKQVCSDKKAELTRAIATECSNWQALIGEEL